MKYINLKTLTKLIEMNKHFWVAFKTYFECFNFRFYFYLGQIVKYHSTNSKIHGIKTLKYVCNKQE